MDVPWPIRLLGAIILAGDAVWYFTSYPTGIGLIIAIVIAIIGLLMLFPEILTSLDEL